MIKAMSLRPAEITPEQWIAARLLARYVLAFGEDTTLAGGAGLGGRYTYRFMGNEYNAIYIPYGHLATIKLYTEDWEATMWVEGPSSRGVTDLRGRRLREYSRAEHYPMYEHVSTILSECRNGLQESEEVVTSFWLLTFGKFSKRGDSKTVFAGSKEIFTRDHLVLKLNDVPPELIHGI